MRRSLIVLVVAALAAVPVAADAAAPSAPGARAAAKQPRLKAFGSCAQLVRYSRRNAARHDGAGAGPPTIGLPPMPMPLLRGPATDGMPVAAPETGADQGSSGTNVQEAGVDEPDIVKTAPGRIFALAGGQLHAVDTGAPRLLGSIEVAGFAHELLLHGDRALVIGQRYGGLMVARGATIAPGYAGQPQTVLTEVDVSDPAAMRVLSTETVDGTYIGGRQAGATARIVISSQPRALSVAGFASRRAGWMPSAVVDRPGPGGRHRRPLAACQRVRHPAGLFSGTGMLSVLTVDLAKGLPAVDVDAVMTDGQTLYASRERLYVATPRWLPEPAGPRQQPPAGTTAVHSFDASQPGVTSYRATGAVPGHLLNQFSLSEHEGFLRVASTEAPVWWDGAEPPASQSFVTVLAERDGRLAEVGRVGGLGHGEQIYAVRFVGDTGFVVTFRQTDPLYTVDLADPTQPRVLGELKIMGYSAYLHPIGDDLLIGVGQDASEQGQVRGTQISLFDVSDLSQPRRLQHRVVAESSSSEVEQDHHAFLWWAPTQLAVLPVQHESFAGAIGFHVDRGTGIAESGRAEHSADESPWPIRRAFVADGRLFTLSELGVEVDDLGTLAELGWVAFPTGAG